MNNLHTQFTKNGFVTVPSFLGMDEIIDLREACERFIENVVPRLSDDIVYYDNKSKPSSLKQVQRLHELDDYFKQLANSQKIVGLAKQLLGGEVELKNMQYFNKVPGPNEATPAHQDGYYFMIKPQAAITMWLSLGEADASNGAVCYLPGSHLKGMRAHGATSTLGFSQAITDWSPRDSQAELQMTAKAGDMLVHHSLTVHRANRNSSYRDRKSIGFIFYSKDVVVDEHAHARYQAALNRKLKEQDKI